MNQKKILLIVSILFFTFLLLAEQPKLKFNQYHTPFELNNILKNWVEMNPQIMKLHKIATSPGGRHIYLVEVGPEINKKKKIITRCSCCCKHGRRCTYFQ